VSLLGRGIGERRGGEEVGRRRGGMGGKRGHVMENRGRRKAEGEEG